MWISHGHFFLLAGRPILLRRRRCGQPRPGRASRSAAARMRCVRLGVEECRRPPRPGAAASSSASAISERGALRPRPCAAFLVWWSPAASGIRHQQGRAPRGPGSRPPTARPRHHGVGGGQRQGEVVQEGEGLVVDGWPPGRSSASATRGYSRSPGHVQDLEGRRRAGRTPPGRPR